MEAIAVALRAVTEAMAAEDAEAAVDLAGAGQMESVLVGAINSP